MKKNQLTKIGYLFQILISSIRWLRGALLAGLALLPLAPTSFGGVTNDFVGGLGTRTDIVDAYPGMPGNGWIDAWTYSGTPGILLDAGVTNTRPFDVGGDYLRWGITGAESALRRKYGGTLDLDLSLPHLVEFDIRCDDWLPTTNTFTSGSDNVTLTSRSNYGNNPSGDSTWYIRAQGGTDSGAPFGKANMWGFYNGDEFNNGNNNFFTNYFPFFIGTNYHFKIEQRPVTKTYIATISATFNGVVSNLTTMELRWRSFSSVNAANQTNSTVLHFIGRISTTTGVGAETNYIALDNLHIYQAPLDPVAPIVTVSNPVPGTIYYPTGGVVNFSVRTLGPTNSIPTNNVSLRLNGVNVSSGLTFGGVTNNLSASYTGLSPNVIYNAVIVASDQAGRTVTNTFLFDTLIETNVTTIETENYNFFTNAVCNANGTSTPGDFRGAYLQSPLPSTYNNTSGLYTNQATGYVDRVGGPGVDFFDLTSVGGNLVSNVFRFCDPVGTIQTLDPRRPAYITQGVPDYALQFIQQGEWWNYTHIYPNSNYLVYLRVSSTSVQNQKFQLARVTSDRSLPNQTTLGLGSFTVSHTGNLNTYSYVPLRDALDNPLLLHLSGEETLRLTASTVLGTEYVNFLLFVPQLGSAPPFISQASPGNNSSNLAPQSPISFTLQNGSAPLNTSTIVLNINGSNVTSSATITPIASGASVSYLPATFWRMDSVNTIQVIAGDGTPAGLGTNQWNFHVGRYLPGATVKINFQTPTFTPTPTGYLADIGTVFGSQGNGYNYGWDQDITLQARDRGTAGSPPDDRYRTLNQLGNTTNITQTRFWEIELPNGAYNVHLVSGDGSAIDSVYTMATEGIVIITNGVPTTNVHWFEGTTNVVVSDGRLTVSAAGGNNTKVNYIDISSTGAPLDLSLRNAALAGSNFSFNIATIQRAVHIVEYKNSLSDLNWTTLTNIVGTGSSLTINDTATNQRFYRMRIP